MNLGSLVQRRAASGAPAIVRPGPDEPEVVPWRQVAADAERIATALRERGLAELEAVAFNVRRSDTAVAAAFGVWLAGGIVVHLDPDAPPDHLAAQLAHAECRIILDELALADLAPEGEPLPPAATGPGDVACYAYVSPPGATPLLAAKLTHGGLWAAGNGLAAATSLSEGQRLASAWPAYHAVQRALEIAAAVSGAALAGGGPEDFRQTRPTVLCGPYLTAEDIARRILLAESRRGPVARRAWRWALDTALTAHRRGGGRRSWRMGLARKLGLDEAAEPLGGDLRLLLTSGERPSQATRDLLGALGLELAALYAVPEAAGPVAVQGAAIDGAELQVADDGQVLVRGRGLYAGYLKEPGESDRALLGGWFRTGDRGEFEGGLLRLLGPHDAERGVLIRVSAPDVEAGLRDQPAIGQALAVPGKPWIALLVPAGALVAEMASRSGMPPGEALTDPRVEEALVRALADYNATAGFEARAMHYALVPALPHDALGRLDRKAAHATYAEAIDAALPAPPPEMV